MGKKSLYSAYMRLSTTGESIGRSDRIRKGYVPVLVGREDDVIEKLWLPIKLIRHPSIVALLNNSADEFGYAQQGLLKISHDVEQFKRMIKIISN
ncbi:Small auxin-up RNA [Parasponia andersonii]|uniref:Small auxin-up RNA n=1 Tax=Parasponia andersonii TaxID=3476 RepID=A0A2P5A7P9_PARAD|nr:Small auxin-up RNA [Parasponia andersonii]